MKNAQKKILTLLKSQRATRLTKIATLLDVMNFNPLDKKGEPLPNPYYRILKKIYDKEIWELREMLINKNNLRKE